MRIGYLILSHAHPAQLGRLCQQLFAENTRLYIHVDANTAASDFAAMQAATPEDAQFIARQPCRWGGFSLVAATLALIDAAIKDDCDYMVLLSAQDFPLKPHAEIIRQLNNHTGFIEFRRQPDPDFDISYRYQSYHPEALKGSFAGKLLQKIQRPLLRFGLLQRKLPASLHTIYSGSQWWCLSRRACLALIKFCLDHPDVIAYFRQTLVPDEMFVQTILMHTPVAAELINDSQHDLEWESGAWSPRTFTPDDLPRLLASSSLFARKFAADGEVSGLLKPYLCPKQ
ncbi:beta-1,6-N-acetylglucosaminyltransferase [Iodobacter sp. LRB]|uniref:beta-1,6-N-acetylglucosaminyltransferase n=1 Tax=unclassified Iodobacter TaxID=235634 RepID=UPI0015D50B29|nr:beta-1,6-N-acetylglucosaminyltransferase [Iodobacter sp. BJB302]